MKKTLLAAALIAGFAGVAQAETSVTLYGILDGGIGYQQVKGTPSYLADRAGIATAKTSRTGMINGIQSGSRWGLKGSEDLGSGLRAVFVLESGFDLGTGFSTQSATSGGEGRLFGRQATLGLAGDSWGQLDIGRQTNIASKYFASIDPFGAGFTQANIGTAFTQANTARYDNMVMYQSPSFSGFQFGAGYSFNVNGSQAGKISEDGNTLDGLERNQRAITTGLRYANGPVNVALTYDQFKTAEARVGADVVGGETVKAWALGGSYDFEVVKAHAAFGQTRNGVFAAQNFVSGTPDYDNGSFTGISGLKFNSYMLGVSAPIGNGTLMASWHMADPRSTPDAWGEVGEPAREMKKQQAYSLGYTYGLSKRTNVYAYGSYAKNVDFLPDAKSKVVGVGVRHQF